jgi:YD repeat-containing protein
VRTLRADCLDRILILGRSLRVSKPSSARNPSFDTLHPLNELVEGEHSRLVAVKPRYLIENKGANGVSDLTTGVRTRDDRTHRFEAYRAPLLGAGETSVVDNVGSIPRDFLDGVHESAAFDGFLFWAQFRDREGARWEVVYDPASRETSWREAARASETSLAGR